MRKLLFGTILGLLVLSLLSGLIFFSLQIVRDIQNNAEWEINLMRIICVVTIMVLATPSLYKKYKNS